MCCRPNQQRAVMWWVFGGREEGEMHNSCSSVGVDGVMRLMYVGRRAPPMGRTWTERKKPSLSRGRPFAIGGGNTGGKRYEKVRAKSLKRWGTDQEDMARVWVREKGRKRNGWMDGCWLVRWERTGFFLTLRLQRGPQRGACDGQGRRPRAGRERPQGGKGGERKREGRGKRRARTVGAARAACPLPSLTSPPPRGGPPDCSAAGQSGGVC